MVNNELIKRPVFENLDTLRFFAFFAVFLSHCVNYFNFSFSNKKIETIHLHFFGNGDLGVNFFFVLSGFLISWLLIVEKEKNKTINIKAFYIRRILRIWPLYFIIVFLGFFISYYIDLSWIPIEIFHKHVDLKELSWYLFFIGNFDIIINGNNCFLLAILWSVCVEEQFYLFWPLFFSLLNKKLLKYLCFTIIIISFIFRYFHSDLYSSLSTFSVMSDLAVGSLACYYSFYNERFILFFKHLSRQKIIIIYILLSAYIPLHGLSHIFGEKVFLIYHPFESLLFSFFFACIILEQNFSERSFFKFGKIKLFSRLGKISYGLYVFHPLTLPIAYYITYSIGLTDNSIISYGIKIIAAFLITILIAHLSYKYIESRFLKFKEKFIKI